MCFTPQRRAMFWHRNFIKWPERVSFLAFWLPNVLCATASNNFLASELQKVARTRQFFSILTCKCASRHSLMQFFDSRTSKSTPGPSVFFAIFRHRNFEKWSGAAVFCTFSLTNVLLATAACNFSFLLWPHASAPAALTSLLFDSPDTRIIQKTQHFPTSLTFGADESSFFWLSRYCIFFLLTWQSATPYYVHWTTPYCKVLLRTTQFYNVLLRTTKY